MTDALIARIEATYWRAATRRDVLSLWRWRVQ
jgi:hypothetical protein